ncbi:MAG: type II toxin-antitoxin system VapC family toxin [Deinococcota bacterium]|jgi:predicted nucleic acid-binding protein|nr:type II toxin-antitoxin system VapC family toxin [Deinococcota bacterium]MDQ3460734.1 type II toxin-antitoxin system VapC family toxin [Deinococcota bacterium]
MRYLLDTNVVLRTVNQDDGLYPVVSQAVQNLAIQGHELILVPQVIYEFWSAASRPAAVNGLGWSLATVRALVDDLIREWTLLEDVPEVFDHWLELVTLHQVSGKQVHDARLVAAMKAHDLEHLLTLNAEDFGRFDVQSLHPGEVLA